MHTHGNLMQARAKRGLCNVDTYAQKKILACMPYAPDRVQDFVLAVLSQPELFGSQNHTFTGERGHVIDFSLCKSMERLKKSCRCLITTGKWSLIFCSSKGTGVLAGSGTC